MASDNQASYSKIGLFIVVGVFLIGYALVRFGGFKSSDSEFLAETFFEESVSGLDVGSAVNLRGVRVGSVRRISFIGAEYSDASKDDGKKIYVEMAFDKTKFRLGDGYKPEQQLKMMVEKGMRATIAASGVTGLSRIELNFPRGEVKDIAKSWKETHVLIPPMTSILQNASDSAQKILDQLNRIDIAEAWSNLLQVANRAGTALENFNSVLGAEKGNVSEILNNVRDASSSLRDFADQIRSNPSSVLRERTPDRLDETK